MKKLQINKTFRTILIVLNALILLVWGGLVFFWYMVITSDIPPAPTVSELSYLNKGVLFWLLLLVLNILFIKFTTKKLAES